MNRSVRIGISICVLLLSAAIGRAEVLIHNFQSLYDASPRALSWTNSNTVGIVTAPPVLNYTCVEGGKYAYSTSYYINLPENAYVTTSVAVEDLTKLLLLRSPATIGNMCFWISTDNSTWTDISGGAVYNVNQVEVSMPEKGNYYLKIGRAGDTPIQIFEFDYYVSPCHCLRVVSE